MDENYKPDQLLSEPSELADHNHDGKGNMSLGAPTSANGDDVSPINGESEKSAAGSPVVQDPNAKAVHDVITSEIGVSTLLNRLKQSIASAKEFATFLKKRSTLEEEHSNGLKKLCRQTTESIRRPEHRHGSFLQSYEEITTIHERMADNGAQFAISLHQMHEDLLEMAANIERGRKHWKTTGLTAEQRAADAEAAMRKSKAKYDSLSDDYDRARTGDRQTGKIFGLKGPKSAQQHEEDLHRKVVAADADYASKVQNAQAVRAELLSKQRPEAVKSLEELIKECDSALTLQMQKFASFNEKLLLSNGLNISPLKGSEQGSQPRSLREVVYAINNERDLSNYLSSYANKIAPRNAEIKYSKNPVLAPMQASAPAPIPQQQPQLQPQQPPQQYTQQQQQQPQPQQRQSDPSSSFASRQALHIKLI
ncbi:hypothetical protein G7Y89_g13352 [Cudoniella acicularis]|uniref:F-BAR domain-containing protein n=1 Tax=Cudoniella acicularis TaxID=354080 RepID=A0A8H4R7G4_9HELO|nr:hypothetical protein G7Y89_g13352 [Cudoniella acicularis]